MKRTETIDPALPVKVLLQRFPQLQPALAAYGLDTCCAGEHPLAQACAAKLKSAERVRSVERTSVMKKKVAFTVPRDGVMKATVISRIHPASFQPALIGNSRFSLGKIDNPDRENSLRPRPTSRRGWNR